MADAKWCEKCETDSHVYDVRDNGARVMRRRECLNCGRRWKTYEINADDLGELEDALRIVETIRGVNQQRRQATDKMLF